MHLVALQLRSAVLRDFAAVQCLLFQVPFYSNSSLNYTTMAGKYKIVMVRHGESEWNKLNKFCGWFDADLSEQGMLFTLLIK